MDPITQQIALASAGSAGGDPLYVDDVFSNYLWAGDGTNARNIVNGIDLSGEGGLVWLKSRTTAESNNFYDTERGAEEAIFSDSTAAEGNYNNRLTAFNDNGFRVNSDDATNKSGTDYCSWTFRKAPGFFDIVTWTGDGNGDRYLSHQLKSIPGCVIVKKTSGSMDWGVYHRSLGTVQTDGLELNNTNGVSAAGTVNPIRSTPTSTQIYIRGGSNEYNDSGATFVAYLFAHDDQSFGTGSNEAIIKCGSVTTASNEYATVDLGFEPQFVMFKRTDVSGDWLMLDTMRGWDLGNDDKRLYANLSNAETTTSSGHGEVNSTGFRIYNLGGSADLIYMAIRRPHKLPSAGTDVFAIDTKAGTSPTPPTYNSGFPVDVSWQKDTTAGSWTVKTRLTSEGQVIQLNSTASEFNNPSSLVTFDRMDGIGTATSSDSNNYNWMFKRAPGFFDVATWTGNGTTGRTINHNLTVAPEFMLVKRRSGTENWYAYHKQPGATKSTFLSSGAFSSSGVWNDTEPTATTIALLGDNAVNGSGQTYVGYFWASLENISKVGSYTGDGGNNNYQYISGFTTMPRFVLIKSISASGDWMVFDSTRGITSGNDPFLELNNNTAEQTGTNMIHAFAGGGGYNGGFTPFDVANTSGTTYLYLAIT